MDASSPNRITCSRDGFMPLLRQSSKYPDKLRIKFVSSKCPLASVAGSRRKVKTRSWVDDSWHQNRWLKIRMVLVSRARCRRQLSFCQVTTYRDPLGTKKFPSSLVRVYSTPSLITPSTPCSTLKVSSCKRWIWLQYHAT